MKFTLQYLKIFGMASLIINTSLLYAARQPTLEIQNQTDNKIWVYVRLTGPLGADKLKKDHSSEIPPRQTKVREDVWFNGVWILYESEYKDVQGDEARQKEAEKLGRYLGQVKLTKDVFEAEGSPSAHFILEIRPHRGFYRGGLAYGSATAGD